MSVSTNEAHLVWNASVFDIIPSLTPDIYVTHDTVF